MSIVNDDAINYRAAEVADWFHSIIDIPEETLEISTFPTLENTNSKKYYSKYYTPLVVSIGPYHRGEQHVASMENFKKKAARKLAERVKDKVSIEQVYASVEQDLLRATRNFYSNDRFTDWQWCQMMFLDGCFIIEFFSDDTIGTTSGRRRWFNMNKHDRDLVRRDLLLFENQLPIQVLVVLARAFNCPLDLVEWSLQMPLLNISSAPTRFLDYKGEKPQARVHLLQFYRDLWIRILFGDDVEEEEEDNSEEEQAKEDHLAVYELFSVTDLKKRGIRCSRASGRRRTPHIHFESSMLSGKLFLPELTICEWTKTVFLNLVAYERSCSLQDRSFGISSYLSFMSMLINGEEAVKELRARGVIQLHMKVDDVEVVNFFKDIATCNPRASSHVYLQILTYLKSSKRLLLKEAYAEFKQRYFSGPWNFLVFLAVFFTVSMTVIQTVFTGIQTFQKN